MERYSHFHRKLFWTVVAVIVLLVSTFVWMLYYNEKKQKEEILTDYITRYSHSLDQQITGNGMPDSLLCCFYDRITFYDLDGKVTFDSKEKDLSLLNNMPVRREIKDAMRKGTGKDIRRCPDHSGSCFYYAIRFEDYIIRSALPFNVTVITTLYDNRIYFSLLALCLIVLGIIFRRVMFRLGDSINKLHDFVVRADRDEVIQYSGKFSKNELGEISRHIVQIFNRLMQTKQALEIEQERVTNQQAEQVRIKRQLTQNIAHELKTPVSSIQGYLETIISNPDIPEEVKNGFIEKGYAQCKRLSSLLHDITYLSRIDEAPEMIEKEQVDIAEIVMSVLNDVGTQLAEKNIKVKNTTENQHLVCFGSPSLLYSVFRNLIDNTIAYSGDDVDVFIDCYKEDAHYFYFSYADNGVGVPEEHLSRIFERFYRIDKGRSRKLGGTGLGLAIVKNAILFHGGSVTAKKYYGGGLEFVFTIRKNS